MAADNANLNGPTVRPNLSEALSTYVSDRTSRRSFLTRAGSFFCGLVGVAFVRAALVEAGIHASHLNRIACEVTRIGMTKIVRGFYATRPTASQRDRDL